MHDAHHKQQARLLILLQYSRWPSVHPIQHVLFSGNPLAHHPAHMPAFVLPPLPLRPARRRPEIPASAIFQDAVSTPLLHSWPGAPTSIIRQPWTHAIGDRDPRSSPSPTFKFPFRTARTVNLRRAWSVPCCCVGQTCDVRWVDGVSSPTSSSMCPARCALGTVAPRRAYGSENRSRNLCRAAVMPKCASDRRGGAFRGAGRRGAWTLEAGLRGLVSATNT